MFTGVFISYDNSFVVYADDKMTALDVVKTGIGITLVVVGIVTTVSTGGLSAPALLELTSGVITSGQGVSNIVNNYILDNGDGTFTMTPEFIQLVLDEVKKIDETGFHDFESLMDASGYYTITGYASGIGSNGTDDIRYIYKGSSFSRPFGVLSNSDTLWYYRYTGDGSSFKSQSIYLGFDMYRNGQLDYSGSNAGFFVTPFNGYGFNFPIFSSEDSAKSAFLSGDFSGALNYREKYFDYSNKYAPIYNGGSVTISKSKFDGFEDALKDAYEKYDDVNDRVDALYEYIFGDNIFGNNGGFDFDIDSPFDIGDWFSGIFNDPFGLGEDIINSLAGFFSDIANGLKKKFPFSIPWDIYKVFTVFSNVQSPSPASISPLSFSDQGEMQVLTGDIQIMANDVHDAPYFKLPIKVDSFGIEEEIIVDMKDFQTLSTFSRTMFSLLFAVALLKFTLKVLSIFGVFGGGGDGD